MNSEQTVTAFFKDKFGALARRKRTLLRNTNRAVRENHPLNVEIRTTYNIGCEVLGASEASALADAAGL